jgi:neprilysin
MRGCDSKFQLNWSKKLNFRYNANIDPCDNFYDYACGSFADKTFPADEAVAVDAFTKLREVIDSQVFSFLSDAKDDDAAPSYKLSKELFNFCLERNRESCYDMHGQA